METLQEVINSLSDLPRDRRCLVVEDDACLKVILSRLLGHVDPELKVDWAFNYEDAEEELSKNDYQLILCDVNLPNMKSGVDLWRSSMSKMNLPVVMMSSMRADDYLRHFVKGEEIPRFLHKPFRIDEFVDVLHSKQEIETARPRSTLLMALVFLAGMLFTWAPNEPIQAQQTALVRSLQSPDVQQVLKSTLEGGLTPYLKKLRGTRSVKEAWTQGDKIPFKMARSRSAS